MDEVSPGRRLLVAAILVLLVVLVQRVFREQQWIFNVQAQSNIVSLTTLEGGETRWRINGAVVCVRGKLSPDLTYAQVNESPSPCGSAAWSGYRFPDSEQALVLDGKHDVTVEIQADGTLFLSIRDHARDPMDQPSGPDNVAAVSAASTLAAAKIVFTDGTPDVPLDTNGRVRVNLRWTPKYAEDQAQASKVFPFAGPAVIGRDVNWAGSSLLTNGRVDVFTADESSDRRKKIDSSELIMGDQVRLEVTEWSGEVFPPKGFIRYLPPNGEAVQVFLDVVAFGAADKVRIERYGDNGYDFRPGFVSKILHDELLIGVFSLFTVLIATLSSLIGLFGKGD